jgi:hypothetical protein
MKIGFSFGRCIRDIVNGVVDIDDVVVIVARTHMETLEHVVGVVDAYMFRDGYLLDLDRNVCVNVATELWERGKIHQPRIFGHNQNMVSEQYMWMDLFPSVKDTDESVTEAWNHYRAMLNLIHGARVPKAPVTI